MKPFYLYSKPEQSVLLSSVNYLGRSSVNYLGRFTGNYLGRLCGSLYAYDIFISSRHESELQ